MYKYIYGPVPSRRLGISLGVDLVPLKVCNFNCIYCECGKSTRLTIERKEYYPVQDIIKEIRDFLSKNPSPDYISFSGSGEPTLHSALGLILRTLKNEFPYLRLAVLTNGSLLFLEEVRQDLFAADVVLPSLDAATEEAFIRIDRPHPDVKVSAVIEGLIKFSREFKKIKSGNELWLEVFIIDGINSDDYNIRKLKEAVLKIKPDKIQLNTLDRPGTEAWVKPAPHEVLERVKKKLNLANVEIISKYKYRSDLKAYSKDIEGIILQTLIRRPSTVEDLTEILGEPVTEVRKYVDILLYEKKIKAEIISDLKHRGIFYKVLN